MLLTRYGETIERALNREFRILGLPVIDTASAMFMVITVVGFLTFLGDFITALAPSLDRNATIVACAVTPVAGTDARTWDYRIPQVLFFFDIA